MGVQHTWERRQMRIFTLKELQGRDYLGYTGVDGGKGKVIPVLN
jgi:hypothetical protein